MCHECMTHLCVWGGGSKFQKMQAWRDGWGLLVVLLVRGPLAVVVRLVVRLVLLLLLQLVVVLLYRRLVQLVHLLLVVQLVVVLVQLLLYLRLVPAPVLRHRSRLLLLI